MTKRKLPKVPRACANEDCPNPVPDKTGRWLCDDCDWKMQRERDRWEELRDREINRQIDERRGK